jgi:SNF2 family DNA or RNA helicase
MVVKKYYGKIHFDGAENRWMITEARPHVCIKLKVIFASLEKYATVPFRFRNTPEMCSNLLWFMMRYPMEISPRDFDLLDDGKQVHVDNINKMEEIFLPDYKPKKVILRNGEPRDYQLRAADMHYLTKRLLLGDDIGLGKTLSGILTFFNPYVLPAAVVVQTHLAKQWEGEITRFTNLRVHIIKKMTPYDLPEADVYIFKYSNISGWVDLFESGFFKSVVFDEAQELRRWGSNKYFAAQSLAKSVEYCMGLTATPIYNYGDEIYNVLNLIIPDCLGDRNDFLREWATTNGMNYIIKDPSALGTYLRDNHFFLRRTRLEVGRELPPINKIIQTVGYDDGEVKKFDDLAIKLALRMFGGSFIERGSAARELDMLLRQQTGVSKAREVAEYVKILLESGEPVVLSGWHREVYDIWKEHLKEHNPVFYTGTESPKQKNDSVEAFISGKTNLFIISNRSGIGLDGLQKRCNTIVIGELDWSPKVHDQLIGRVDRDGRDIQEPVTAIFCVSEYGSDPVIMDMLGLKASQSHNIVDPLSAPTVQMSDDSRIQTLAKKFLEKKGITVNPSTPETHQNHQPELF